jgi:hypothetical protein
VATYRRGDENNILSTTQLRKEMMEDWLGGWLGGKEVKTGFA